MPTYDKDFFAQTTSKAQSSACAILPILLKLTAAESIVDVGCGDGTWLHAAGELGINDMLGLDGAYVRELRIPRENFQAVDLAEHFSLQRTFDLAISLEVAEHLPPARAESFIADLVALAPTIAFSAAIPGQGGREHVNERWADYWQGLFVQHGYRAFDVVRGAVWDREDIAPWYAQNTFVYSRDELNQDLPALPARLVHPGVFAYRITTPTLSEIRPNLLPMARDFARWRFKRLLRR